MGLSHFCGNGQRLFCMSTIMRPAQRKSSVSEPTLTVDPQTHPLHSLTGFRSGVNMGLCVAKYNSGGSRGCLLGIDRVIAEVLPSDKARVIRELQGQGRVVAMVGDGGNDAPAIATADIGIAIGSGSDVAKETGGIILVKNDVRDVVRALPIICLRASTAAFALPIETRGDPDRNP